MGSRRETEPAAQAAGRSTGRQEGGELVMGMSVLGRSRFSEVLPTQLPFPHRVGQTSSSQVGFSLVDGLGREGGFSVVKDMEGICLLETRWVARQLRVRTKN